MAINFDTAPYFDDFDVANDYYRVLFKPRYAVQARELNQLQSILQHQITSVGKHLFKKNSMVIPGGISINRTADLVSVDAADPAALVGKTITNAASFDLEDYESLNNSITAVVLGYRVATDTDAAVLYVKYFRAQDDDRAVFDETDTIQTVEAAPITFATDHTKNSTVGKVATLAAGTFFTRDIFVDAATQNVIVEIDNKTVSNCTIGLTITESIVSSYDDDALLDNSQGSPNQYAPGADRYKVSLDLVRLDPAVSLDDENFIKMMVIENDVVVYLNNDTQYALLMKTLARRTFDANGNFIVRGLETTVADAPDDDNYVLGNTTRGKCYLGGYEYNQIANSHIAVPKPRDAAHQEAQPAVTRTTFNVPYFLVEGTRWASSGGTPWALITVNGVVEEGAFCQFTSVALDAEDNVDLDFNGGEVLGYGVFRGIEYHAGTRNVSDIYKVFFTDISLKKGVVVSDIGGIKFMTHTAIEPCGASVLHEIHLTDVIGVPSRTKPDASPATIDSADGSAHGCVYRVIPDVNNIDTVAYVLKNSVKPAPTTGRLIINSGETNEASGTVLSSFVSNYDPAFIPMVEVNRDTIKTIESMTYYEVQRDTFTIPGGGTAGIDCAPVSGDDEFVNFNNSRYIAYAPGAGSSSGTWAKLRHSNIDIAPDKLKYTLVIDSGDAWTTDLLGQDIFVYSLIKRVGRLPAEKTLTDATINIPTPSDSWMALAHQDGVSLTKVVDGRVVVVNKTSARATSVTWSTPKATVTVEYTIPLAETDERPPSIGDTVIVKGIKSTNNTSGLPDYMYNGKFVLTDVASSVTTPGSNPDLIKNVALTLKYVSANGGTFDTSSDATMALPPDITRDVDITSRYVFDGGSTANMTATGTIKRKKNTAAPQGQIAVKYNHYVPDATGGYVSVDSYGNPAGDLGYIGEIANVTDDLGNVIKTRQYIDFRTRPSNYFFKNLGTMPVGTSAKLVLHDLNLSAIADDLILKYVCGPALDARSADELPARIKSITFNPETGNSELILRQPTVDTPYTNNVAGAVDETGTYYIGLDSTGNEVVPGLTPHTLSFITTAAGDARFFTFPKDGTRTRYTHTKFLGQKVLVYVDRKEDLLAVKYLDVDANATIDNRFQRDEYKLPLALFDMAPYTVDATEVVVSQFENPVYQMMDIHNLKKRIDRNEYYTSLALDSDHVANPEQGDPSRGFWHEDFMKLGAQDYTSNDFLCTIYDKSYVAPGVVTRTINLELDAEIGSATWQQTGSALTLPYTEARAFGNDKSSRSNNLNPYNMIQWAGKLTLNPSVDNWIDTTAPVDLPPVQVPPPVVPTEPPYTLPQPPVKEIVTKITNLRASWGPDSRDGKHAISFDWETNLGRTGRVNTDKHLSDVVRDLGAPGFNGDYAKSLINTRYNKKGVKEYLHAGRHFDRKPPNKW